MYGLLTGVSAKLNDARQAAGRTANSKSGMTTRRIDDQRTAAPVPEWDSFAMVISALHAEAPQPASALQF